MQSLVIRYHGCCVVDSFVCIYFIVLSLVWMWQFYWVHLCNNLWGQPIAQSRSKNCDNNFEDGEKKKSMCKSKQREKKRDVVCFSRLHIIDQSVELLTIKNIVLQKKYYLTKPIT